jgi:aryl-alcohol dehydrogenase-like predicted oxidoreductase
MRYRTLGRTGLRVSEVGYGGGRVRGDQDEAEFARMFRRALDAGVNVADTAPTYGGGRSETLLGAALQGRRHECVVATKTEALLPDGIRADVEGSLRRLRTEVIDVLQFHGGWFPPEDAAQILEQRGLETYLRLRDEGKVRFLGFSADGPSEGVERLIATGAFDVMQVHYNIMYQSTCDGFSGRGIIPAAKEQGMGVLLMRSTASGAFRRLMARSFPDVEEMRWERLALNYALSNPLVDVALMSLRSVEDVEWTNEVSDDAGERLDLRALHRV